MLTEIAGRYAIRTGRLFNASVAVTGSVARGDAVAGSDIDLWVVGNETRDHHRRVQGIDVTLMCQRVEKALEPENLALFELDDLWVVYDPHGHFHAIRRAAWRLAHLLHHLRRDMVRHDHELELQKSSSGPPLQRLQAIRHALHLIALGVLTAKTGRRFAKTEFLRQILDESDAIWMKGLGLPLATHDREFLLQHARKTFSSAYRRALANQAEPVNHRHRLLAALDKLEHHNDDDGVLQLRRFVSMCLLPHLGEDPFGKNRRLRQCISALHGVAADPCESVLRASRAAHEELTARWSEFLSF